MAKVDYSLRVSKALAALDYDDIPSRHRNADVFAPPGDAMVDEFMRGYISIRNVSRDLAKLGADALPAIRNASDPANYYAQLALIDAAGEVLNELDASEHVDTRDWLLAFLDFADDDIKRRAVQALTKLGDPAAAKAIEPLCKSSHELLKDCSVYAMTVLSTDVDKRFGFLIASLRDGEYRALRDVLAEEDGIPFENILLLLSAPDPRIRETVQHEIGIVREVPLEQTLILARDDHLPVRQKAVETLAKSNDEGLFDTMFVALQDPEKPVANAAARWLKKCKVDFQAELRPLLESRHSLTRKLALDLLRSPLDPELIEPVAELLGTRSTSAMRRAAIRKLKPHARESDVARAALLDALGDATIDVRKAALAALKSTARPADLKPLSKHLERSGKTGGEQLDQAIALVAAVGDDAAVEVLRAQLEHPDRDVRRAAIEALGEVNAFDLAGEVRKVQDEEGFGLRSEQAAERLERLAGAYSQLETGIGDKPARKRIAALTAQSPKAREIAVVGLRDLDDPLAATLVLQDLLFDDNAAVRKAVHSLLEDNPQPELLRHLRETLKRGRYNLAEAIEAIAVLGDSKDAKLIEGFVDHFDKDVRASASAALAEN